MATPISVALLGFSHDERRALALHLGRDPRRVPAYAHVLDIDLARFVVADADHAGAPELLDTLGRTGDTLFVGERAPARAAARVDRPLDPGRVLVELDALVARRDQPASVPAPRPPAMLQSPVAATAPRGAAQASPEQPTSPAPATKLHYAAARRDEAAARRQRHAAGLKPVTLRQALLVDDSEVALAFLERHLLRHGIASDWAMNSGRALALLSQRNYGMVFLDIDLGDHSELDGLALCQQIKRQAPHGGGRAPVVVLVSALNEPADRVRGTLAGADGHIGKPLDEAMLDRLLRTHGLIDPPPAPPRRGG